MRRCVLLLLVVLTAGCWTPGPGRLDPTRYPWDQVRNVAPEPRYCVVALDPQPGSGITFTGNAGSSLGCTPPSAPGRKVYPASNWKTRT